MDKDLKNSLINYSSIKMLPIKVKFNITTLDYVLAFIYKDSVLRTRKTLSNINKLFCNLDMSLYEDNDELSNRIWVIKKILEGKFKGGLEGSPDILIEYCLSDVDCDEQRKKIAENIPKLVINYEESKFIVKKLDDTLQYGYVITLKDIYKKIINSIDDGDFKSYKAVQDDLYDISTSIINIKRSISSLGSDQTFSLVEDQFDMVVEDSLQKLKDRNKIFVTGIKRWNTLLSPGYMSKRLYTYLAFPGKGKSTILLKSAIDIRRYNTNVAVKDPDKRPAVLFLTLENTMEETIERLYNMTTNSDDIRNYTFKQVRKDMIKEGHLELTDENNIDLIIKEYKNRELDTNDLYSIINDLSDDGVEVIALIIDYMKRLRPAEKAHDEKGELKNISNELKELAKYFDIPVSKIAA